MKKRGSATGRGVTALVLCAAALLFGCAPGTRLSRIPTATVVRGTFAETILLTGELEAVRATSILSPRTAEWQVQIIEIHPEGETCREGDAILRFDPSGLNARLDDLTLSLEETEGSIARQVAVLEKDLRDLALQLSRGRAALRKAELQAGVDPAVRPAAEARRAELQREGEGLEVRRLEEEIRLRRQEGDAEVALLEVEKAKVLNELEYVRSSIDAMTVHAPQDGLIVVSDNWREGRKFKVGDTTWPGRELLRIPDLREMQVEAWAHELDATRLRVGQEAVVVLDMYPEARLPGRVAAISNAPSPKGRESKIQGYEVVVELERTDAGRMRPGMSARVLVVVEEEPGLLLVPRRALFVEEEERVVYVREDGGFQRQAVVPIGRNDLFYALREGPKTGSLVALRRPE